LHLLQLESLLSLIFKSDIVGKSPRL
jgi:hypothetical protein